jgi:hypothetical protein
VPGQDLQGSDVRRQRPFHVTDAAPGEGVAVADQRERVGLPLPLGRDDVGVPGQDQPTVVISVAPVDDEVGQAVELEATAAATERSDGVVDEVQATRDRVGAIDRLLGDQPRQEIDCRLQFVVDRCRHPARIVSDASQDLLLQ